MAETPTPRHLSPRWSGDTRPALPSTGTERETLGAYLDWHRATFAQKCAGLSAEQLSTRAVPPSALSLYGLVRHLAGVERWWFRIQFAGEEVPLLHYSDDDPDQDFEWLDGDPQEALAQWQTECERSQRITNAAKSLDETGIRRSTGEPVSLRTVLVHLLTEYARHNGHADLLRERLDGATGA
ncbi:DinB family protein [Streptomyces sp. CRN 30]|uniref:DinB family protein n=1 Tax=Streptomyces sp. CRN 30 TaxID=3075613 RepID=UPI002A826D04|nr:DinB family protein [Streptomyces sp. CRN 30]